MDFPYAHPHPHEVVTQRIIIARAFGHRTPSRTLATRRTNSSFGYGISVTAKKQLSMTTIAPAAHYSSENYISHVKSSLSRTVMCTAR